MAVFERKKEDKILVDDSHPLCCSIIQAQNVDGHVEYTIEVWRKPDVEVRWQVRHRYSDFAQLHAALKGAASLPVIPPKKVFGNMDRDFVNERMVALHKYVTSIQNQPVLAGSLAFKRFLDPENYSGNIQEEARQNVHLALISGGSYEVVEALPAMGTRTRKHYFMARQLGDAKSQFALWWAPFGPDKYLHIRDVHTTLTSFVQCQHPFIVSAVSSIATEAGVCVIRPWFPQGTVRDLIWQTKPRGSYINKYASEKGTPIPTKDCAIYGRQILQALLFLHEKGIGFGHLHTGNLVVENNICKLIDIENQTVGLPNPFRHFITQHRKINSYEAIDVYSFGHTLYEMVFGQRLETDTCDDLPVDCLAMFSKRYSKFGL